MDFIRSKAKSRFKTPNYMYFNVRPGTTDAHPKHSMNELGIYF